MSELPKSLQAVPIPDIDQGDRFSSTSNLVNKVSLKIIDPNSRLIWGYISIDNTDRGPGLGGIRMVQDLSLNEIRRLALVMTLKNSAACLPYGGAKAGLILKSHELAGNRAAADLRPVYAPDTLFQQSDLYLQHAGEPR